MPSPAGPAPDNEALPNGATQAPAVGVLLPSFDPVRTGRPRPGGRPPRNWPSSSSSTRCWAGDHLACPAPGLDAPACLAAAAAVTERIALGFSVMLLGLRTPAWTAKQLTTIDVLSRRAAAAGRGRRRRVPRGVRRRRRAGAPARRAAGRRAGGDPRPGHRPPRRLRGPRPERALRAGLEPAIGRPAAHLRRRTRRAGAAPGGALRRRVAADVADAGPDRRALGPAGRVAPNRRAGPRRARRC